MVAVSGRTPESCAQSITHAVTQAGLPLPAEHLGAMVDAAAARPTPQYLTALSDAYVSSAGNPEAGWCSPSPETFYRARLQHLITSAPFSPEVCRAFLGLLAAGSLGVSEQDFLQIAARWPATRQAIVGSFSAPPVGREVPSLVWHRLRVHFRDVVEDVGLFDDVTSRPRTAERAPIIELVRDEMLRDCTTRLTQHLWQLRESPPDRVVLQLPELLARGRDPQGLRLLFQTKGFTKQAIQVDRGRALMEAWRSQEGYAEVSPIIVDAPPSSPPSSVADTTHWLLDLAILLRSMGQALDAAKAAHRALELRQQTLPAGHPLLLSAALEATDGYLEAAEHDKARNLAEGVLLAAGIAGDDASAQVQRLRGNLAAAHAYRGEYEKALPIYVQLVAAAAQHPASRSDAAAAHNDLASCYLKLGNLDKALEHSDHCMDLTVLARGEEADRLGPALVNRAFIFRARNEPREATACFQRALEIYDRHLDRHHPWRMNAAMALVTALTDANDKTRALDRMAAEAAGTSVFLLALWSFRALPLVLDGLADAVPAAVTVLKEFAASLRSELATQGIRSSRAQDKYSAFITLATMEALQHSHPEGPQAFMLTGISRWLFAYVQATAGNLIARAETVTFLRDLDAFLSSKLTPPTSLLWLESVASAAWSEIEARHQTGYPRELFRTLVAEATGRATRMIGRVESSDAELAESIDALEIRLAAAQASQRVDENEVGELRFLLSSKYAAAGRFEEAVRSQTEVVQLDKKLFGERSRNYWSSVINLGSVLRQAARPGEAFARYQQGLRELASLDEVSFHDIDGPLQKAIAVGIEAQEFAGVGNLLDTIARRFDGGKLGVSLPLMAIGPWVRAGRRDLGLKRFHRAALALGALEKDVAGWLESALIPTAHVFMSIDMEEGDRREWHRGVRVLRTVAEENGLMAEFETNNAWVELMEELTLQEGLSND